MFEDIIKPKFKTSRAAVNIHDEVQSIIDNEPPSTYRFKNIFTKIRRFIESLGEKFRSVGRTANKIFLRYGEIEMWFLL